MRGVAPTRMRVNGISPGAIRTPLDRPACETPDAHQSRMRLVPCKRIGEFDDIGRAAVWLAAYGAEHVTGTRRSIDGGMTLYTEFETGG